MRTAPVALAYLDDELGLVEAAGAVSELTHYDPMAGDACVLWCLAIRHAVLTGELDARIGLRHIDADRRDKWAALLDATEFHGQRTVPTIAGSSRRCRPLGRRSRPRPSRPTIPRGSFRADHLRLALDAAVHGGYDTDTVAAIAGGLLGAVYGRRRFPRSGVVCCTTGPGLRPGNWWRWPPIS